jgi:hypothetical protein
METMQKCVWLESSDAKGDKTGVGPFVCGGSVAGHTPAHWQAKSWQPGEIHIEVRSKVPP